MDAMLKTKMTSLHVSYGPEMIIHFKDLCTIMSTETHWNTQHFYDPTQKQLPTISLCSLSTLCCSLFVGRQNFRPTNHSQMLQ